MSEQIVTVDIGGTHARFAIAEVEGGRVLSLGEATTLHTKDHASFQTAWQDFERQQGGTLPRAVAIAIAGPTRGEIIRFTNNPWIIRPALVGEKLNVDRYVLVNDFEAVGHAVAQADASYFERLTARRTAPRDGYDQHHRSRNRAGRRTYLARRRRLSRPGDRGRAYRFRAARQHRGCDPCAAAQAASARVDRTHRVGTRHRRHL